MSEESKTYDASVIVVLEGLEAVRRRPGMYLGSVGERGLHQLVFEVVGRALEQILGGAASRVEITLTDDGGIRVADDGAAHSIEQAGHRDSPSLEAQLTTLACGSAPVGRHALSHWLFGAELAVANALSRRLTAEVRRDGGRRVLAYERGVAVAPPASTGPVDDTGTVITFWPDAEIFETVEVSYDVLAERLRELAFLNCDLDITLTDARCDGETRAVHFRFPDGLRGHVAEQGSPLHRDVVHFELEPAGMEGVLEVALRWCDFPEERLASYANSVRTTDGGTHELGFRDGLTAAVNAYGREQRLLDPSDPDFTDAQLCAGLAAVVSVKLDHPEFEGATRRRLGNRPVRACVAEAVRERLTGWLHADPARAAVVLAGRPRG